MDITPAQQVVDEITAAGGEAVVNGDDVSDFGQAKDMIHQASAPTAGSTSSSTTPASCGTG